MKKETKETTETTEALIVDTDYSVLVVEKKDLQAFFLDAEPSEHPTFKREP